MTDNTTSFKMETSGYRVAIITGAGSGIGEETSYAFAKKGLSVVLVDMDAEGLVKVADKIKNMGVSSDKILTVTQDLTDESSFEAIINKAITKFGKIDVLVNNAGFTKYNTFEDITVESADRTYQVMLRAPLFLSQKAFPHLKKTKGIIINVSSVLSRIVVLNTIDYCAIKAGLEHLTRCLALEGAAHGIRVNAIHPGAIRTGIFRDRSNVEEFLEGVAETVPMGRVGTVTDIASAIVYLASEGASYITGASLLVDGGFALASPWSGISTESASY